MRKITLLGIALLVFGFANAQHKGGFRVGLDLGFVPANGGAGILFSLEPKYNIADNMNVGLRLGAAAIARDVQESGLTTSAKIAANGSYVGTYDYYFHNSDGSFAPYVGAGFGYYSLVNVEVDDIENSDNIVVETTGKTGGLVRAGFEWGKFRMGVEYNIIPDSDLQDLDGNIIGTASNSYLGIHLGFYVGGGRWGK